MDQKNKADKNIRLLYAHTILTGITSFVIGGGVLQTFLLEYGIGESRVSMAVAVFQIVQAGVMLLFASRLEQVRGLLKVARRLLLLELPLLAAMGIIALKGGDPDVIFPVLLIAGILTNIGLGLAGTVGYKIPYILIDMDDYGRISGLQGTLSGLLCMGLAALLPLLLGYFSYRQIAPMLPLAGITSLLLTMAVYACMKEERRPPKIYGTRIDLLKYRPFLKIILPSLARGFGSGLLGFMTTIGYHAGLLNDKSSSMAVFITYATSMLGNLVFAKLTGRERDPKILRVCGIALAVLMPFLIIGNDLVLFLIIFTLCQFFRTMVDVGIPVSLAHVLDYEAVIQVAAWRLALGMASASLAVWAAVPMVDAIGYVPTFLIGGLLMLYSCFGYAGLAKEFQ